MKRDDFCRIARRLMRCPTAPFHEHAVRAEVERLCVENALSFRRDRFGNVLVHLRTARVRPLALAAHMDHPGFDVLRRLGPTRWLARFLGGVGDPYFKPGLRVRLMPSGEPARLHRRVGTDKAFELRTDTDVNSRPRFAVWEMHDFAVRKGRIHGRACDDLVGVAAILATMIDLKRRRARVNVVGVISRAEEVGFRGALAATIDSIPRSALIVSLETSRQLPVVRMDQGVILRVGDKASVFDPEASRFLSEVAADLARRDRVFRFQRALMSGGTCEATAYQEFGFQTAAVCVALGNYHNCGANNRIAPEYVSVKDACGMVDILAHTARCMPRYGVMTQRLPLRLRALLRNASRRLAASAAD
jgi:endoglucanase